MKKIIITISAIALSFGVFAQRGCNYNTPGWGASLGTISFATNQTWTIGNQTWSDAVTATACQKNTFNGEGIFSADCRSNSGFPGDLFSWCAVVRFANQLCPAPWRVPTRQDFINLDIALGGNGNRIGIRCRGHLNQYIDTWGGAFAGAVLWDNRSGNSSWGNYWSRSSYRFGIGFSLIILSDAQMVQPQGHNCKGSGLSLRCIRDN